MNHTIFYSWQSDLISKCNRSFILDALKKASKEISKDGNYNVDTVIDRDTIGISGSPSITSSAKSPDFAQIKQKSEVSRFGFFIFPHI